MKYSLLLFVAVCVLVQTADCQNLQRHYEAQIIETTGDWRPYPISNQDENFKQIVVYARRNFAKRCPIFNGWKFEKVVRVYSQIVSGVQFNLEVQFSKNSKFVKGFINVWQHPLNPKTGKFQFDITSCGQIA